MNDGLTGDNIRDSVQTIMNEYRPYYRIQSTAADTGNKLFIEFNI